ncbi:MAG: hypothetical protein NZM12_08945 [Steroidobacteraceae bacterium]|nr:hypothetical protein [Steroidobacteraceae bacterium]
MALRVLHAPFVVGGHASNLARAERALGLDSWSVALQPNLYGHYADEILWKDTSKKFVNELRRWRLIWRAARKFDVIHYNFGTPLTPLVLNSPSAKGNSGRKLAYETYRRYAALTEFWDVALLSRLRKAIFVTYQGDDARQADFCLSRFEVSIAAEVDEKYYPAGSDELKRQAISRFDYFADKIFALNPDLLHVLPKRAQFLPYAHIDLAEWRPEGSTPGAGARLRIVHAPSHRGAKGTRYVLGAIDRLRNEGLAFDFLLVENLPHAEAQSVYRSADLAVDQLLAGWYGGFAVELMALGKPVICYIRDEDLRFIPSEMARELPVIPAQPASIYRVLRECLTERRTWLAEVGTRSRAFVERWHDPRKIAAFLRDEYLRVLLEKRQRNRTLRDA